MIYEYAIDPEIAVSWGKDRAEYRYFMEKFGLGTPRIMSEFPKFKNWRKQFRQAAMGADETNELPRITALFQILTERRICREGYNYDGTISWLENAEMENMREEFHAVLSSKNPRNNSKVLTHDSLESSPLWSVKRQDYCERKAANLARLMSAILSNSSEVHFIDPHFGPENARHRKPIEACLEIIAQNRSCRPSIEKITLHTSIKSTLDFFRKACEEKLCPRLPKGVSLILQRWDERPGGEKLHNRYVLTDIGGVKIDPGLDTGDQGQNYEIILLERKLYEKYWNDYITNPAFDPAEDQLEMIGTKRN